MIERILDENDQIDRNQVFLTGHSNGCAMAQHFLSRNSDLIAGVACFSMFLLSQMPGPSYKPRPIMEIHSFDDPIVNFKPPTAVERPFGPRFPGAIANFDHWRIANNCSNDVDFQRFGDVGFQMTGKDCVAPVRLLALFEGAHFPYPTVGSLNTTNMAWEFLMNKA